MLYADGRACVNMDHFAVGTTSLRPGFAFDHVVNRWLRTGWYLDLAGCGLYGPWSTEDEALKAAGFLRRMLG